MAQVKDETNNNSVKEIILVNDLTNFVETIGFVYLLLIKTEMIKIIHILIRILNQSRVKTL
jgi:hypothetical protein